MIIVTTAHDMLESDELSRKTAIMNQ
jgi:hypothetical protein